MTLTLTYDLDFQSPASYGHDLLTCIVQGQRSVGSEDRVETNAQTDVGDCITSLANAIINENTTKTEIMTHLRVFGIKLCRPTIFVVRSSLRFRCGIAEPFTSEP